MDHMLKLTFSKSINYWHPVEGAGVNRDGESEKNITFCVSGGNIDIGRQDGVIHVVFIDVDDEEFPNDFPTFLNENCHSVIVRGEGGVWEIIHVPGGVNAEIIDYDNGTSLYSSYCKNVTIEILRGLTDDQFSCTGEDFAFVLSSMVEQMTEKQVKQVCEAWAQELHDYFEFYVETYGPVPCNPFNDLAGYVHDCLNFGIRTLVATAPIITDLWINDIDIDSVRGELIKHIEDYGVIEFHEI